MALAFSKEWSDRVAAFEQLSAHPGLFHHGDLTRLLVIYQSHINDRNPKVDSCRLLGLFLLKTPQVSIACLNALVGFLPDADSSTVRICVQKLLQPILLAQLDTKDQVLSI
jgi:hypothetical protein